MFWERMMRRCVCMFFGGLLILLSSGVEASRQKIIRVNSAEALVKAIGSHRKIEVLPGRYELQTVANKGSRFVSWTKVFDGYELLITGGQNLTIEGVGTKFPNILTKPRYAFVMRFSKSKNIILRRLILGHIPKGGCQGGVVGLEQSSDILIEDSQLFGSGTIGIQMNKVQNFLMNRSRIYECTYQILDISDSSNIRFRQSTFEKNGEYHLIDIQKTKKVLFDRCVVRNNFNSSGYSLFQFDRHSSAILKNCRFQKNRVARFTNRARSLKVVGGFSNRSAVMRQINQPNPQYNQIYKLIRYRKWMVAGTQAGIVFWNTQTGKVAWLHKAFISSGFLIDGSYLWVATHRKVIRFDGLVAKTYFKYRQGRGFRVFRGSYGQVMIRLKASIWRFSKSKDRFVSATVPYLPRKSYHFLIRRNKEVWSIKFLSSISRSRKGQTQKFRLRSKAYSGSDPRKLYLAPDGILWTVDFVNGFFFFDSQKGSFVRDTTVKTKGSDIALDAEHQRLWLLHYTKGLYLKRPGKPSKFFPFPRLKYMRCIFVEKNGDVWIGGWGQLVRLSKTKTGWSQTSYIVGQ